MNEPRPEPSRIDFDRIAAFRKEVEELAEKHRLWLHEFEIFERDDMPPRITLELHQMRATK